MFLLQLLISDLIQASVLVWRIFAVNRELEPYKEAQQI